MKKVKDAKGFGAKLLDYMSVATVFLLFIGMMYKWYEKILWIIKNDAVCIGNDYTLSGCKSIRDYCWKEW